MVKMNHFFGLAWVKLIIAVDSHNRDLLDFLFIDTRIFGFSIRFESFLTPRV